MPAALAAGCSEGQGCQIFLDTTYQNGEGHKIYQMIIKIPNRRKIDQVATKYTNIIPCTTLQNLPKFGLFGLELYHLATLAKAKSVEGSHS
jgi:hypothetical protein